jgi:thioredoxin reductase
VETTAEQFAQKMIQQALSHGSVLQEHERAESILATTEGRLLVTTCKADYEARWIIVATGMGKINPRRLGLPREAEFVGKGLHYAVLDPSAFAGKRALVVGGGDSAVDNALLLGSAGAQVLVAHRRPSFEAQPRSVSTLKHRGTVLLTNTRVLELLGDQSLEGVRLLNTQTKEETAVQIDALVINIGLGPELGTVRDWGLDMEGHFITVDSEMRTSRDGVFACGDAVCYPGKVRLVVTAIGEAAVAVNSAVAKG